MQINEYTKAMHKANHKFNENFVANKGRPILVYDIPNKAICVFDADNPEKGYEWHPASLISTYNPMSQSWMWTWHNDSIPEEYKKVAQTILEKGKLLEIPELVEGTLLVDSTAPIHQDLHQATYNLEEALDNGLKSIMAFDEKSRLIISRLSSEHLCGLISHLTGCDMVGRFGDHTPVIKYVAVESKEPLTDLILSDYARDLFESAIQNMPETTHH